MKNQNQKAFTLVELIVVITILAILGTIAFINLQGYSTGARDSKRLSDINNIQKKISIETSKGTNLSSLITLVKTNSGLTINSASGTSIQGTANFPNLKENGDSFKDPITGGDYILSYSIGGSGTGAYKFTQISTVNEENNQAIVKGNYYQMQAGDSPSITLNPDDTYFVIDGGSDLPYELVAGLGSSSSSSGGPTGWMALDTNCDIPDIPIYSGAILVQTWAGCNSTLGNGFEWGQTNADIGLGTFNGTVLSCYDYEGNNTGVCTKGSIAMSSNSKANSWYSGTNVNGDSEYDTIWGKLYTWDALDTDNDNDIDSSDTSGVCPTGYHVPNNTEWEILETTLNGGVNCRNASNGLLCDGLGWNGHSNIAKNDTNNLANALKIPLAGHRVIDGSTFYDRGFNTYLWSSTTYFSTMYNRGLYWNSSSVNRSSNSQAYGFSVRCIKD